MAVPFIQLNKVNPSDAGATGRLQALQTAIAAKSRDKTNLMNLLGKIGAPLVNQGLSIGGDLLERRSERKTAAEEVEAQKEKSGFIASILMPENFTVEAEEGGEVPTREPLPLKSFKIGEDTGEGKFTGGVKKKPKSIESLRKENFTKAIRSGRFKFDEIFKLGKQAGLTNEGIGVILDNEGKRLTNQGTGLSNQEKQQDIKKKKFDFEVDSSEPGTGSSRAATKADLGMDKTKADILAAKAKAAKEGKESGGANKKLITGANTLLNELNLIDTTNVKLTKHKGFIDRKIAGAKAAIGFADSVDADIVAESAAEGQSGTLAARLFDVGNLTEQEQQKGLARIPRITDQAEVQQAKSKRLRESLDRIINAAKNNPGLSNEEAINLYRRELFGLPPLKGSKPFLPNFVDSSNNSSASTNKLEAMKKERDKLLAKKAGG